MATQVTSSKLPKIITDSPDHTILARALIATDLMDLLDQGEFTLFAPNDAAFNASSGALDELLMPENKDELVGLLKNHLVSTRVKISDLRSRPLKTAGTEILTINPMSDGSIMVNDAKIIRGDLDARNGVVHVIDKLLMQRNR
jgi:uncharacterized surface protein with fasciclin (FAS1) repeats